MTALAPGVSTLRSRGWRAGVVDAAVVVLGQPSLWIMGALGFAARGGLLLMALPILTIPSPVVLSIIFRGRFGAAGMAPELEALLAGAVVIALLAGLVAGAYADVAGFERMVRDPSSEDLRAGITPGSATARDRRRLVLGLATIQAAALVPAIVVGLGLYQGLTALFIGELRFPSSLETPIVLRVLGAARDPLLILGLMLVLADVLYALASRALLSWHFRVGTRRGAHTRGPVTAALLGADRLVSRPLRTLATAALCWLLTVAILVPVLWAVLVAWDGVRGAYLSPLAASDPAFLPLAMLSGVAFTTIWLAGWVLAGFASALRAALWSADALR